MSEALGGSRASLGTDLLEGFIWDGHFVRDKS
jgi:hypothetical protein